MPEAPRCGQTQHLREKRRRALLIFAPNDGVIEFDHKTSLRGLHQPALRDRRLDEGSEERTGREGLTKGFDLRLRMELYAHKLEVRSPTTTWSHLNPPALHARGALERTLADAFAAARVTMSSGQT